MITGNVYIMTAIVLFLIAVFAVITYLLLKKFEADQKAAEQQRQLEEADRIRDLKDIISSMLNNMPCMTFTKDAETGVYLACNQAFADYAHKRTPEEVTGLTDAEIFDPETAEHFVKDDRLALSMNRPYIFFEDVPDAAGNMMNIQTTKIGYTDDTGRRCVLGMCQDMTDIVRIRHENIMSKEAYENALSSGVMFTHIAQTLARDYVDMFYVNTDSEEFIEYRRDGESKELSEMKRGWHFFSDCKEELSEKVYPDDRQLFLDAMERTNLMEALSRRGSFVMTYRQSHENGPVYVRLKATLLAEDEHFVIIGISDVDAEMRDAISKSEALAEALTSAEEANRSKTSFLSNMSHEIRTPMNAIIGLDSLALKSRDLDEKTREYLEKIGESAGHLLAIINDVLDMSRIESGRIILRREKFSFSTMIEQINTMIVSQCGDKGLEYECRILSQVDDYYIGDDMKLKEVLLNILSNAVKYTDAPGSVTFTVERIAKTEDQSTLRFGIEDTGIGMDADYIPKVFDAFSQEDSNLKNKYGSTGLGMTITKSIVEMMNGSISVESEKGVGTEFSVTVTLRNCDQTGASGSGRLDPQALNVLVVDDDRIAAEHARSVLEEVGIHTDICTSGEEALRMMKMQQGRNRQYNLVLMDWNMPGMSGMEASNEIRKLYDKDTTVVIMTAYNWDDIREEAHRVGVDSFLPKPLFASDVLDRFEQIARRNNLDLFSEKEMADLLGRRVLIAEDMEFNAEILADILEMEGIESDHAENGRIAVDMFEKSSPGTYSAILMDVRMPVVDGLKATETIRAMDREDAKRIPIIALTANAFDEDVRMSMQAGMNAHLAKPVEPEHLYRTLGELIYDAEEQAAQMQKKQI